MRDTALIVAGLLAILIAVVHTVLGETKVFANTKIEPAHMRRLLRLVWHVGSVFWIGGGVLLLAASQMPDGPPRQWIAGIGALTFGSGALANAVSSRLRHFGWAVLAAVAVLAVYGA